MKMNSKYGAVTLAMVASTMMLFQTSGSAEEETLYRYSIAIKSGAMEEAGTRANIYLKLKGSRGESREIHVNPRVDGESFEPGLTKHLVLKLKKDIGAVEDVIVRSDMKNGDDWWLHYIGVNGPSDGGETFDYNRWIRDTNPQASNDGPAPK